MRQRIRSRAPIAHTVKLWGVPISLGTPEVNANRLPIITVWTVLTVSLELRFVVKQVQVRGDPVM